MFKERISGLTFDFNAAGEWKVFNSLVTFVVVMKNPDLKEL
ncbi:MAG: hypothetical protein AB1410_01850 [Acidobacteriota bacterium]